jgi:hypothetical protein
MYDPYAINKDNCTKDKNCDSTNVIIVSGMINGKYHNITNYSSWLVDVLAPSGEMEVAVATGDQTSIEKGSSGASAIVAGVSALVKELNPEFSGADLKKNIIEHCDQYKFNENYVKDGCTLNSFRSVFAATNAHQKENQVVSDKIELQTNFEKIMLKNNEEEKEEIYGTGGELRW